MHRYIIQILVVDIYHRHPLSVSQAKSVEVGREKGSHSGIPLPAMHSNFCSVDLSACHQDWDL